MSCPSFEILSAGVDGALSDVEAAELGPHLDGCEECQRALAELRLLKNEIRKVSLRPEPGRFDGSRFAEAVRQQRRWKRRRRVGLGAAIVAALVAAGVSIPLVRQRQALAEMIGDHVDITVKREEAFDVVGSDPQELARSFRGKINFALQIPRLPDGQLVGARLCNIQGRGIPLASYELRGHRVSVFVAAGGASGPETRCEERVKGYTVCRRSIHGVDYLLVSDYPAAEAKDILGGALATLSP